MPDYQLNELEELVGTSKITVEDFHVEAGKVEEFARAIEDDNPVHRSQEAADQQGFSAIPAPLTFSRVSVFPRYQPDGDTDFDLGFDRQQTVLGEREFEFERPLYVGDTLTGTTTLTDVFQKEGSRGGLMTFAVLETEYRDQGGELVATERTTKIETADLSGGESDD